MQLLKILIPLLFLNSVHGFQKIQFKDKPYGNSSYTYIIYGKQGTFRASGVTFTAHTYLRKINGSNHYSEAYSGVTAKNHQGLISLKNFNSSLVQPVFTDTNGNNYEPKGSYYYGQMGYYKWKKLPFNTYSAPIDFSKVHKTSQIKLEVSWAYLPSPTSYSLAETGKWTINL